VLSNRAQLAAAFVVALLVYGLAFALIQPNPNGDEPHYVVEAVSIARDGDVDLANQYDDAQLMQQVYGATSLEPQAFRFPGGHGLASVHTPGLPLLLAPVAAVTTAHKWMRLEMVVIAALGAALLMALLARVPFGGALLRWLVWAPLVFSAPVVVYASAIYPELPGLTLLLAAAVLLARERPGLWALAGASASAGGLAWVNVRFTSLAIAIAAIAVWRAWSHPRRAAAVACALGPVVALGLALAIGFAYWYGSPWPDAPYALSTSQRSWSGVYRFGVGAILARGYGVLPQVPLVLLGIAGIGVLVRRLGRPAWVGVAAVAFYLLVIGASGVGFPGSSFPGRLMVVLVPLAAVPLLVLLAVQRRWWVWGPAVLLAVVGLWLTATTISDHADPPAAGTLAGRYLSHWPTYAPKYETAPAHWAGDVRTLDHDIGRVVRDAPPGIQPPLALAAPAGASGTLLQGRTQPMAASAFTGGVLLRALTATDAPALARLEIRDSGGKVVAAQTITPRALPPQVGWRSFPLGFHTADAGPLTLSVRTTGAVALRATAPSITNNPGATLLGSGGFNDVGATIGLIVVVVAAGLGFVLYDRRAGRISLA
jgi:hypothetical protein